jgi:ABC-type transport system involved in multi-copper enzyme maturation permease subunit
MNWSAWRIQRTQFLVAAAAIAALALWLVASRLAAAPASAWAQNTNHGFDVVLYVVPGLIGLALGAPVIAGEVAQGTNRLAWSQSVTRTQWLRHKLLVGAGVSIVLLAVLDLLTSWWTDYRLVTPTGFAIRVIYVVPRIFGITGIVSIGYALFAFSLGTALGAVLRRPGWAFAAGVPIVVLVRLLVDGLWPRLVTSAIAISPPSYGVGLDGYVLQEAYLRPGQTSPPAGQTWDGVWKAGGPWKVMSNCTSRLQGAGPSYQERIAHCAATAHLQLVVQYQPESHYWPLQGVETGIFLGLSLVLFGATYLALRWWRG